MEISIPLTLYQKRFWLEWRLDPDQTKNNTFLVFKLKGQLDLKALEKALAIHVQKWHDQARCCFIQQDLNIVSIEKADQSFHLEVESILENQCVGSEIAKACEHVFDLSQGKLFYFKLLKLKALEHILILNFHHIITDGRTARLTLVNLQKWYLFFKVGGRKPVRQAPYFEEYALQEKDLYRRVNQIKDHEYWFAKLKDKSLSVPLHYLSPDRSAVVGDYLLFSFEKDLSRRIIGFCQEQKVSIFVFLITAFSTILSRLLDQKELVLVYAVDERTQKFQNTPGCFANTLPFLIQFEKEDSFEKAVQKAHWHRTLDKKHQRYTLVDLIQSFKKKGLLKTDCFFNVSITEAFLNCKSFKLGSVTATPMPIYSKTPQNELHLAYQYDGLFHFKIEYIEKLWDAKMAARFAKHFEHWIQAVLAHPQQTLEKIDFLTDFEKTTLFETWNQTETQKHNTQTTLMLFEAQVRDKPQAIACQSVSQCLRFDELNRLSEQLAILLSDQFGSLLEQKQEIGILLEKSFELVIAIFAVLKLGKAIVPIEAAQPNVRIEQILEAGQIELILSSNKLRKKIKQDRSVYIVDRKKFSSNKSRKHLPKQRKSTTEQLLYIMYTSGTTGCPKGVMISDQSLVNLVLDFKTRFQKDLDRVLSITAVASDLYLLELFLPILVGGTHQILPEQYKYKPERIVKLIEKIKPTFIMGLPSVWMMFIDFFKKKVPLFQALVGGEWLSPGLADKLLGVSTQLWQAYGPTETTVWSTLYQIEPPIKNYIGQPLANTQCFVIDRQNQIMPIGFPGQLCIAGRGVFKGYLNQPDLTQKAFVILENAKTHQKIQAYKTGDNVLWHETGALEFIGRTDKQVKIRGVRVELSDIEQALETHLRVNACVVEYRKIKEQFVLIAYYALRDRNWEELFLLKPKKVTALDLKTYLLERRPDYMCPVAWCEVDDFPKTITGKIDRAALPDPSDADFLATLDPSRDSLLDFTELHVKKIWEDLFKRTIIGVNHNFFEIGGDSLQAVFLTVRLNEYFKIDYPVVWVFQHNTIRMQAAALKAQLVTQAGVQYTPLVAFQSGRLDNTLFLVHPGLAGAEVYDQFAQHCDPSITIYGIDSYNLNSGQPFMETIEALASYYVDALLKHAGRKIFLGGWSLGGVIAFEMARQLQARNIRVEKLYLFDSYLVAPDLLEGLEEFVSLKTLQKVLPKKFYDHYKTLPDVYVNKILASLKQDIRLFRKYKIFFYKGDVMLLKTTKRANLISLKLFRQKYNAWEKQVENMTVTSVKGTHFNMMDQPYVETVATTLSQDILALSK